MNHATWRNGRGSHLKKAAGILINGKYQGVFLNIEDVNGTFAKSHFADGGGNLYCYFDGDYQAALRELLAGPFSERVVEEKLVAWSAQISAAVSEANATDSRQLTPKVWADALTDLRARVQYLRAQAQASLRR